MCDDVTSGSLDFNEDNATDDDDGAQPHSCDFGAVRRAGKLLVLEQILPTWHKEGHRVLLFSQVLAFTLQRGDGATLSRSRATPMSCCAQTRRMLNIIEGLVRQHGWRYGRLDGSTAIAGRQTLVDSFNDESSNMFIMLMTTRTGGVGLNLTGADRVLLFDPDWNPQTDAQARRGAAGCFCRAINMPTHRPASALGVLAKHGP